MLSNFPVGKYYVANSNIHRMNPLSKIICTVLFIIMALFGIDLKTSFALSLLVLIMILNSSIPFKIFARAVWSLRYIIILMLLFCALFGLPVAGSIAFIINFVLIVLYTIILTMTTPPTELIYGFEMFLMPLKILGLPTNKIALYLSMALRFIPTLLDECARIMKSQASRGVDYYHCSLSGKIAAIKGIIVPTFKLSILKTKQLIGSMKLRLFSLGKARTNFRINKWHFFDTYLIFIHILILIVVVVRGLVI